MKSKTIKNGHQLENCTIFFNKSLNKTETDTLSKTYLSYNFPLDSEKLVFDSEAFHLERAQPFCFEVKHFSQWKTLAVLFFVAAAAVAFFSTFLFCYLLYKNSKMRKTFFLAKAGFAAVFQQSASVVAALKKCHILSSFRLLSFKLKKRALNKLIVFMISCRWYVDIQV